MRGWTLTQAVRQLHLSIRTDNLGKQLPNGNVCLARGFISSNLIFCINTQPLLSTPAEKEELMELFSVDNHHLILLDG